ncbi:MAG: hypothetical protein CMH54_03245 [Myxococcales bacterium]|nr:hypothetical protein [Myxococcales bacterium]
MRRLGILCCLCLVWACTTVTDPKGDPGSDSIEEVHSDATPTDSGAADPGVTDPGASDSGTSDPGPDLVDEDPGGGDCEPGSGCFGELCTSNGDCQSGVCLPHMGDMVCSSLCVEDCPQGWNCVSIALPGSDLAFACVSDFTHLCRPCSTDGDCSTAETSNACVSYGEEGSFCGASCDEDVDCPERFVCEEMVSVGGAISGQCVSEDGVCECSQTAIDLGLFTPCEVSNDTGTCSGSRVCSDEGLSACDAPEPTAEICNGLDDNCDGSVDEATCDDGNPCTEDVCNGEAGCSHTALEGTACSDENACTHGDICVEGSCVGTEVQCQDTNPCTDDLCDEVLGCDFAFNEAPCDDDNPCTLGDTCGDGVCVGGAEISCSDNNPCTEDSCDPAGGCVFTPNTATCDDGNLCTTVDTCSDGSCHGTTPLACDDENVCTTDVCDPLVGCEYASNTAPCDDGNVCTIGDICGADGCVSGSPMVCDDGNSCTDDSCDPDVGCVFTPNADVCNDLNECTTDDQCSNGWCTGTGSLACDDGNACTLDTCLPGGGCQHDNVVGTCSDGDACTMADYCLGGACVSGTTLSCDDGNDCTVSSCDAMLGCVSEPIDGVCDDENVCTLDDICSEGSCVGGGTLDCDDANVCTLDSCDADTGCVHTTAEGICADPNASCQPDGDGTACACNEGFTGDGDTCTEIDECDPNPCVHGSCTDGIASFTCECDEGFEGILCNINIDDCTPDPCLNGGTCFDGVAGYVCDCPEGWGGTNCDEASVSQTFEYTGSIVSYVVPAGITSLTIEAWGAQGSDGIAGAGGLGAHIRGDFIVSPGETLSILVGQKRGSETASGGHYMNSTGGGGGSFIARGSVPLVVAGGGGGGGAVSGGQDAVISESGLGGLGPSGASGGTGGNGGGADGGNNSGRAGAGFFSNGGVPPGDGGCYCSGCSAEAALSFVNGGTGGPPGPHHGGGGFGGGGCGGNYGGGGGGGYSGGGGGSSNGYGGGGGGSFNGGLNPLNEAGVNSGHGRVVLSW